MSDKMSEVFEEYDITIHQTMRGRGATILKTNKGVLQLKGLDVNEKRLQAEYQFKEKLYENGFFHIDRCIANKQGELVTYDRYGNPYVMRQFFEGKECCLTDCGDIDLAVDNLANLHMAGRKIFLDTEGEVHIRLKDDFKRRNQELKRIRQFVGKQNVKREFEELYINYFDYFFNQAIKCQERFREMNYSATEKYIGYCHGMYNQHSILIENTDNKKCVVDTISFDKFYIGNQLADLYHFIRKTVEKNNYDADIMKRIIRRYGASNSLNKGDVEYIYMLYSYPEKFYKISNQYMNSPKNWISPKMLEKLQKVVMDEEKKHIILQELLNIFTSLL